MTSLDHSASLTSAENVADYLLAGKRPEQLALITSKSQHSYGEIGRASSIVASRLIASGAEKQDRVLLIEENGLAWVSAYLGILRAGLICVPLPPGISAAELSYSIATVRPNFVIANRKVVSAQPGAFREIKLVSADVGNSDDAEHHVPWTSGGSDLAALMFTSGSTGKPRAVSVSHANIIANTESIISVLRLSSADRIMNVLPWHYCFGTSLLHTHLRVGASLVAEKGFVFTQALLQRLAETECTGLAGVPSHFQILLRRSSFCRMSLPSLRYLQQAGGHLAPVFVRELRAAFPKTEMFIMYGQTEATARLSYLSPEKADRKPGSVGSAIPGVTLHIVDSEGRALPPGEVGEIVAEGPNICQGYWEAEEETRTYFRQGKLHTGDLGTFDAEGDITILDRAKSILKCGGKRISCRQIEETLLEFDEIAEAAVIGMPDETLGEAVKAFVAPRNWRAEGLEERLLAFCRSHLASVFVPREIVCLRELPKSNTGKILKEELKKLPAPSPSCAVAASSA